MVDRPSGCIQVQQATGRTLGSGILGDQMPGQFIFEVTDLHDRILEIMEAERYVARRYKSSSNIWVQAR